MQTVKKEKIENCIIYFFIFAFLGWISETIYAFFIEGTFVKRGFLFGPICPMYGYGTVMLIFIADWLKEKNANIIQCFLVSSVIFTIFEYITSLMLELIFGIRWWDYSNEFLNFQGRVCLSFSLVWGLVGVIFIKKIYDPSKKGIEKVKNALNKKHLKVILTSLVLLTVIDILGSSIRYII